MAQLITATFEELKNRHLGAIGTPGRDAYEAEVKEAIQNYHVGEAIKAARKEKNMTQQQLGDLMGVKKAQISRIENGQSFNLSTVARAFKAMGLHVSLDIEGGPKLALW